MKQNTTPVTAADSVLVFEIMEARNGTGATLIASQCEPEQWYVRISSELIADSTLSRITGAARYLQLEGPDMRRKPADTDNQTNQPKTE